MHMRCMANANERNRSNKQCKWEKKASILGRWFENFRLTSDFGDDSTGIQRWIGAPESNRFQITLAQSQAPILFGNLNKFQ